MFPGFWDWAEIFFNETALEAELSNKYYPITDPSNNVVNMFSHVARIGDAKEYFSYVTKISDESSGFCQIYILIYNV